MKRAAIFSVLMGMILFSIPAMSQNQQQPAPSAPVNEGPDPSGMYQFFRDGEFIQLAVENDGTVQGSISRFASRDATSFVDHVFTAGTWHRPKLTFKTRAVHGVMYEFEGTVEQNPKQTDPHRDGFWVMKGKLVETGADNKKKSRDVSFKSMPNM